MGNTSDAVLEAVTGRVVHRSVVVEKPDGVSVVKLMVNLVPGDRSFEAGMDVGIIRPGAEAAEMRHYTIDAVGGVPFEESVDLTIHVRVGGADSGVSGWLASLGHNDQVDVHGPYPYPFYPPMGSRSNLIFIGAGCGMTPFRWLAHKIHARRMDWMGKVLMLEGEVTGLERQYANDLDADQDQYFDVASYRAFERLKTRYSPGASDNAQTVDVNLEAMWRLMGQGSVFVYVAGYREVAARLDAAMEGHLRLPGRWQDARSALIRNGHWLEFLYD
jgi:ferredoxin-NADP reductase